MLKGESDVNECSKVLEVSDLLHFLALHADELISEDGICVACTPVASQTQLIGLGDIQVHKAPIKPGDKAVDELTVGGSVSMLQAGNLQVIAVTLHFICVYSEQ